MSIFQSCDVRGVYGKDLTDQTAHAIGRAVSTVLGGGPIIVGGDVRTSTPALKASLISGLVAGGGKVVDIGIVPTPAFYFARQHLGIVPGVMVTASHNPPAYNGFKIVLNELPITEEQLSEIRFLVDQAMPSSVEGDMRTLEIIPDYERFLEETLPSHTRGGEFRVALDCGNGCYSRIAPALMRRQGYTVLELFCEPDGTFPNRLPNSAEPSNLRALARFVPQNQAHLGVAFDGDGDRVAFIDERGEYVPAEHAAIILCKHFLGQHERGRVVYDIKSSSILPEFVESIGGVALPERSGHTFIKTRMIREMAVFGAEISGHYFFGHLNGGDDGLHTAVWMAHIVEASRAKVSDLTASIPRLVTTPDIRIPFHGDRRAILDRIASSFSKDDVSLLDGVRVNFGRDWALARESVTEPLITLRFECSEEAHLDELVRRFVAPVPELAKKVGEYLAHSKMRTSVS
ncbi:MAG: phosphomannomutase/phosphoglucomutase [Armatimonadetes bacterium]|nr:phosphomannomutase/phosphoglucomutase [Armatimonadota bacterium]